jgi:hypothetical protein
MGLGRTCAFAGNGDTLEEVEGGTYMVLYFWCVDAYVPITTPMGGFESYCDLGGFASLCCQSNFLLAVAPGFVGDDGVVAGAPCQYSSSSVSPCLSYIGLLGCFVGELLFLVLLQRLRVSTDNHV